MDSLDKYDSLTGAAEEPSSSRIFTAWVLLSQVLGLSSVILVAVWTGKYLGGFAWQEDPSKEFNYHPLFMVIGLVFLYGDAILVYRVFRNEKKFTVKLLHGVLHVFVLIFSGVGLKAVFDSHNLPAKPAPNMYSLHSWLGIITIILFGLQWLVGLCSFLIPAVPNYIRVVYKPFHVFWGLAIFVMAIATALIGLTEKSLFSNKDGYSQKNAEGILVNCLGLVLVALGLTVAYIITNPNYQRQETPDEERIQLTQ